MPFALTSPLAGYTLNRINPWRVYQGDIGHGTRYCQVKTIRVNTDTTWRLTTAEADDFETWFRGTMASGAELLTTSLAVGAGGLTSVDARITGPYRLQPVRGGDSARWFLAMPLEIVLAEETWGAENTDYPDWSDTDLPLAQMRPHLFQGAGQIARTTSDGVSYPILRKRASSILGSATLHHRFSDTQFSTFLTFWEGTLHAGSDWFIVQVLEGSTVKDKIVRATGGWRATVLTGCRWDVTFPIEVRDA